MYVTLVVTQSHALPTGSISVSDLELSSHVFILSRFETDLYDTSATGN